MCRYDMMLGVTNVEAYSGSDERGGVFSPTQEEIELGLEGEGRNWLQIHFN